MFDIKTLEKPNSSEDRQSLMRQFLGKKVSIIIDRPIGSTHPDFSNLVYPVNYGYFPNVNAHDEEALDGYLLGVDEPLDEYDGYVIGFVHRRNDNEDKLVVAPQGMYFSSHKIAEYVNFQEQYFESEIVVI